MTPTLIGYLPKRFTPREEWLFAEKVEEICSVSNCIAQRPEGLVQHWKHNDWWLYDSPALAWKLVSSEERGKQRMYGYLLFPIEFRQGKQSPLNLPPGEAVALTPDFEKLGYDVVSLVQGNDFAHSPLSCNHVASGVPTNRYCLLEDLEAALQLAEMCEADGCEPGPYGVVEVWRFTGQPPLALD